MIDHVSCIVKNLKQSTEFYTKAFGLKVIRQWERKEEGLSGSFLGDKNNSCMIELIESKNPKQATETVKDLNTIGINHIAFSDVDIDETIQKIINLDGKLIRGPEYGKTVKKLAFLKDLDGIVIELIEHKD